MFVRGNVYTLEVMAEAKTFVYGKHAVREALAHVPQAVAEVFIAKQSDDADILALAHKHRIPVAKKMPSGFDYSVVHQGVVATVIPSRLMRDFGEFMEGLTVGPDTALVLLGELDDPHNVGAVIRSAAAFGLAGVLIPERREAPVTGAAIKVSAGMAFRVPLVSVGNVNAAVRELREHGLAVYGLAGGARQTVTKEAFELPTLFIVGNESGGIREKTRELCDKLLAIPIHLRCESLNAAASCAVAFYAWSARHPQALGV